MYVEYIMYIPKNKVYNFSFSFYIHFMILNYV